LKSWIRVIIFLIRKNEIIEMIKNKENTNKKNKFWKSFIRLNWYHVRYIDKHIINAIVIEVIKIFCLKIISKKFNIKQLIT